MLNASVGGRLEVSGTTVLSGELRALHGACLGSEGKTILFL